MCSTLFFSNKQTTDLHMQHTFCLSLPLFSPTTTLFCRTKTSNFLVTCYYYGGIVCLPNILSPVFIFTFIFHCHSFSPCWPLASLIISPPLWIFMFSSYKVHLFCFQSLALALSVRCLWHSHGKNPVRLYPKLQSQPIGLPKIFIDYLFVQADQSDCTKSISIF